VAGGRRWPWPDSSISAATIGSRPTGPTGLLDHRRAVRHDASGRGRLALRRAAPPCQPPALRLPPRSSRCLGELGRPDGPDTPPRRPPPGDARRDHPLDYYDFAGVIAAGQYGAGDVVVWDWGVWALADGDDPLAEIAKGSLHCKRLGGASPDPPEPPDGTTPSGGADRTRGRDAVVGRQAEPGFRCMQLETIGKVRRVAVTVRRGPRRDWHKKSRSCRSSDNEVLVPPLRSWAVSRGPLSRFRSSTVLD